MIALLQIVTTNTTEAIIINTHKLQKIFSSPKKAVNINSLTLIPAAFGTAQEVLVLADSEQEEDDQVSIAAYARIPPQMLSVIQGDTGLLTQTARAGFKDILNLTTSEVAAVFHQYSLFPVFNHLKIGWSVDLGFSLLIDFTVLDRPWNMRAEVRNLIGNKRRVEDPNLSNVDGKRSVVKAQIRVPEE